MRTLWLISLWFGITGILWQPAMAQDTIKAQSGRVYSCNITRITPDTIFFTFKNRNEKVETFSRMDKIVSYQIGKLEAIKASLDTSAYYQIALEDGTELFGKIRAIEGHRIRFNDNMLNQVTLQAEDITAFDKENREAFYKIELATGKEIFGRIVKRSKTEIQFKTKSLGKITVKASNVEALKEIEPENLKDGKYWFPNPNTTRYYFAPTAMNLNVGEGYYQNAYIIGNSANYGLTENFSMGGILILPVAVGITPKFGFQVHEKVHLGGGLIGGIVPGPSFAGLAYGVATYGSIEANLTLGTGFVIFEEEFYERPVITLSGMTRVSRRVALVSENWALPVTKHEYNETTGDYEERKAYEVYVSYGLRVMKERIAFDFALINSKEIFESIIVGIPYIDFVYRF